MSETLDKTSTTSADPAVPQDAANWFEIPTTNLERATQFYEHLLAAPLRREFFRDAISLFPASVAGVGGALVHRDNHQPAASGTLVYLNCDSGLAAAIERMESGKRGTVIVPITHIGPNGSYAVVRDSEGNHIGLHEH